MSPYLLTSIVNYLKRYRIKCIMEDTPAKKDTYYQRNRERVLSRVKDNYKNNRAKYITYNAQYYQEHRDNIIEQHKAHNQKYYQQNRAEVVDRRRERFRTHREEALGRNRDWIPKHPELSWSWSALFKCSN